MHVQIGAFSGVDFLRSLPNRDIFGVDFLWSLSNREFTDIEHDSQRCFVLQSLLLFRRVSQIFTDMTLVPLMCGQCVSKSIVVSQCLPTVHRVCQKWVHRVWQIVVYSVSFHP